MGSWLCGDPWVFSPFHFLLSLFPSEIDEDRIPNPLLKVSWSLLLSPAQRTQRLLRGLFLRPPSNLKGPLTPSSASPQMRMSGQTHTHAPYPPHPVSLLTVGGGAGSGWQAGNLSPHFLKPTADPQSPIQKHGKAQKVGEKGRPPTCALCPSQSTLAMSPRQRKKVTRTTPTMKG